MEMSAWRNLPGLVLVLVVALIGLATPIAALGQTVVARSASNDEIRGISDSEDGSASRSIYSQKHLSPHRMMHFGKRPLVSGPPVFFDLYRQPPPSAMQRYGRTMPLRHPLPYSLYFDLPRDQVLEFVQPDSPKVQLLDAVPELLEYAKRSHHAHQQQQQQQINQQTGQVSSPESQTNPLGRASAAAKTTTSSSSPASPPSQQPGNDEVDVPFELSAAGNLEQLAGGLAAARKQSLMASSENSQQADGNSNGASSGNGGQPEQQDASGASNGQQDGDGISLASRSPAAPAHAGEMPFQGIFRQPDISSYLYGPQVANPRPGQSLLTLGGFIKKAEPQRNAMKFMHFGR